jgi:hypothetical protein
LDFGRFYTSLHPTNNYNAVALNNMAYLIKCKNAANIAEPEEPIRVMTDFIR